MDNIISPELAEVVKKYSRFFEEVRRRILFTFIFFIVAAFLGFIFYEQIVRFLIVSLSLEKINIVFTSPFQFINLAIGCGVVTGLVAVVPLIIFQILAFLRPALKAKEFRATLRFLPFSIFLFIFGFVFGILVMKWQIGLFLEKAAALNIGNILDISGILNTTLLIGAIMGIAFQLPVILLLLLNVGVLSRKQLTSKRPWVYLGSFIFTMFLPIDSVLADLFLALPMIILFEITLFLNLISKNNLKSILKLGH
ncbi:preprotein translocase subunit TatC [candidate division WWE3 bacterium]|uniref:Sec-independent protein translocase protein TatC n=1 Tax=candidate division WWE3 bacterium TaxID=2053526 RepID=A0A3A4ZCK1_UNCKA|nr:MAG: preprotein translocase subunit TatC [candidate division WWE3 bacterium]